MPSVVSSAGRRAVGWVLRCLWLPGNWREVFHPQLVETEVAEAEWFAEQVIVALRAGSSHHRRQITAVREYPVEQPLSARMVESGVGRESGRARGGSGATRNDSDRSVAGDGRAEGPRDGGPSAGGDNGTASETGGVVSGGGDLASWNGGEGVGDDDVVFDKGRDRDAGSESVAVSGGGGVVPDGKFPDGSHPVARMPRPHWATETFRADATTMFSRPVVGAPQGETEPVTVHVRQEVGLTVDGDDGLVVVTGRPLLHLPASTYTAAQLPALIDAISRALEAPPLSQQ